jgi:crotonobetainyl-CoA:carnitine CoA-transferase CaiB-like acyl-CoA transferase
VQPLAGRLVVDLTRLLPGPYASRELLRLGARVVRIEPPGGDPLRVTMPHWHEALNAGKESVVCDLKADPSLANAICAQADVVLEGFRPGVADALGLVVPPTAVYCSITGFGDGPRARQAGHDLNYLGYAGALADTAPALPPVQIADLAAGALGAVVEILAALVQGGGARIAVSMTHNTHRLVDFRSGDDRLLTGDAAFYRIYETADGRHLTVAALEPKFFARLTELIGRPELEQLGDQDALAAELAAVFLTRPLAEWLELFAGEDVCAGPVLRMKEAAAELGEQRPAERAPGLGEHTDAWRRLLHR